MAAVTQLLFLCLQDEKNQVLTTNIWLQLVSFHLKQVKDTDERFVFRRTMFIQKVEALSLCSLL